MSQLVQWSATGSTGELRLTRPEKRNALSGEMVRQGRAAVDSLVAAGVTVAAIQADGQVFCAGDDISPIEADRPADLGADSFVRSIAAAPILWVAVVAGPALGAGVALAATAAVVLCSDDAWFRLPERRLGIFPGFVVDCIEPLVGARRALSYALEGEPISAQAAVAAGLATESVVASDLHARAAEWIELLQQQAVTSSAIAWWAKSLSRGRTA